MKKLSIIIAFIVVVFLIAVLLSRLFQPASQQEQLTIVNIPSGTSLIGIAELLRQDELLSPVGKNSFIAAALLSGRGKKLKPGRYRLSPTMSPWLILETIYSGKVHTMRITIPEGYSLSQIGDLLAEKGIGTKASFIHLTNHESHLFETPFPRQEAISLEGYLFPDTYEIDGTEGQQEIVSKMLRRFEELVWQQAFKEKTDYTQLPLHEILTIASLVEGEARIPEERSIIAGVIMNRLHIGMRLQCDATVQYALGDHKPRLTHADLKISSPYNTYLNNGLPPGPINNPGLASIEAAMQPASTPFLYYVARSDGSHIFSRTYKEHLRAISKVRNKK